MRTSKHRVSEQPAPYGKLQRKGPAPPGRRYPLEEMYHRGNAIYKKDVLPHATPDDQDKYVLIDIETGEFEMDLDEHAASDRLRARVPDPQIWMERIGHPAAREITGFRKSNDRW